MGKQIALLTKRFGELFDEVSAIEASKWISHAAFPNGEYVDAERYISWRLKARNLLSLACGTNSEHYREFAASEGTSRLRTNFDQLQELRAIFRAAREDFEGGYLNSVRNMIHAEVYGDELEQASGLLKGGYKVAAAVIAGVVLETGLRQLCASAGLPDGNINRMNSELAKAGAYNALVTKQITALADIRNNAAHGHPEQFTEADVANMISRIESFLADHF